MARHQVLLNAVYVPSRDNIADALSRGDIAAFLAGFPGVTARTDFSLPPSLSPLLWSWPAQQ